MNKTTTPPKTPSPTRVNSKSSISLDKTKSDKHMFIGAVLNLTWQMAIVVLVPIVGGFQLDKKLATTPLLTIIGFLVSTFGVVVVLWHQLQLFTPPKASNRRQHS